MGGMDSGHSKYAHDWWVVAGDKGDTVCSMDGLTRSQNEELAQDDGNSDAWFIVNARTDVPDLVAEVRRLRALEDKVTSMIAMKKQEYADLLDDVKMCVVEGWDEGHERLVGESNRALAVIKALESLLTD
jgi:hypothetical protein